MAINRDIWLNSFLKNHFPNWNCPYCGTGVLRPTSNSFHYWESADSRKIGKKYMRELNYPFDTEGQMLGMELSDYRYSVLLKCNNAYCQEHITSCGGGYVVEEYSPEISDTFFYDKFYPIFFYPSIEIFSVSEKCPKEVINQIKSSFKLFFADPPASANYVRKAVDSILTDKKIKRLTINPKGKKIPINLHNRISEFEKKNPTVSKKLFAIKWLGNEGSHTDKITKNDVLDAYEILEEVIDDLYVGYKKLIEKKINKINKSKKPLHPTT
jgi:hypothetical protein